MSELRPDTTDTPKSGGKRRNGDECTSLQSRGPRRRLHFIFLAIVIIALILTIIMAAVIYQIAQQPLTLKQLADREFDPGDTVEIQGTITRVTEMDTSYGPLTLLQLDNYDPESDLYQIKVENDRDYKVGDHFETKLRFEKISFNGDTIVTSKKLYNTYIGMPMAMNTVLRGVSYVGGFALKLLPDAGDGTVRYEVGAPNGDSFPMERFSVSLRKGSSVGDGRSFNHQDYLVLFGVEYVYATSSYDDNERIDFMDSLADGTSQNGLMEFIDADSNGLIDSGDRFEIDLLPTSQQNMIETYYLEVGGEPHEYIATGCEYIINWHEGPYVWHNDPEIYLEHESDEVNGSLVDSTVRITGVGGEAGRPYADYELLIRGSGGANITDTHTTEFMDINANDLLDTDDLLVIRGLESGKPVEFLILENDSIVAQLEWIAGVGHIPGNIPDILLFHENVVGKENTSRLKVEVGFWHPHLALNSSVHLSVEKDDETILDGAVVREGLLGGHEGRDTSFADVDGDMHLSDGDHFILEYEPGSRYTVELSWLFGTEKQSLTYTPW